MEDGKKHPSLPANYVSLAQLQERWLKEQERKQKEKEREEARKQREIEERERKRENQQNRSQNRNGERSEANSVSISRRPFRRDRRYQRSRDRQPIDVSEPNWEKSRVEDGVVQDEVQKADESKKTKKKRKWKSKSKRGAEEHLIGSTALLAPENELGEKSAVVVTGKKVEKETSKSEFPGQGGDDEGMNNNLRLQKASVNQTLEIEQDFKDLTLNGGGKGNEKSVVCMNGRRWMNNGGSGSLKSTRQRKPCDSNLVWVRKGEISETTAAENRSKGFQFRAGAYGKQFRAGEGTRGILYS